MATSLSYKVAGRTERNGVLEAPYTAGMKYTDIPLTGNYCKTLVNFETDPIVGVLRPRKGYITKQLNTSPAYSKLLLEDKENTMSAFEDTLDILYSGKLYIDVLDVSEIQKAHFDSTQTVLEFEDIPVEDIKIVSELRDVIMVGARAIANKTTLSLKKATGSYYRQVFVLVKDKDVWRIAINYTGAEIEKIIEVYFALKGLPYKWDLVPSAPNSNTAHQIMRDIFRYSTGIGMLPKFNASQKTDVIKTSYTLPVLTALNSTLYFLGGAETDEITCRRIGEAFGASPDVLYDLEHDINFVDGRILPKIQDSIIGARLRALHIFKYAIFTPGVGVQTQFYATAPVRVPREVSASEVLNYGYNMLLKNPYDLKNDTEYSADTILLDGILVKDASTNDIKLSARVGERLKFELLYKSNTNYSESVKGFRVRWELTDSTSSGNTTVLQDIRDSEVYHTGDIISLNITPSYKTFSIICKVYRNSDVEDYPDLSREDLYNNLSPIRAITLASYTLTDNTIGASAELKNFDLSTATGMCTWADRLVLWGVQGAETNIFVSEAGTTDYFPYPHGYDEFPATVIKCLPYGQQLLVFTETELYLCTLAADGLTYTKALAQSGLNIHPEDRHMITAVHNMVSFKNEDKYYLIVPKRSALSGEIQLAPISTQINYLLANFETEVTQIIKRMYGTQLTDLKDICLEQKNIYSLAEGAVIKYIYIYDVFAYNKDTETYEKIETLQPLEVALLYNTTTRIWSLETHQSTLYRKIAYKEDSLGTQQHLLIDKSDTEVFIYVESKSESVQDSFLGSESTWENVQFLDTGYRATDVVRKKRFRELQYVLNNTGRTEITMGCAIFVDDMERKPMYDYEVNLVPTTDNSLEAIITQSLNTSGLVRNTTEGAKELDEVHNVLLPNATPEGNNLFKLDVSKFEYISNYKVRVKISGKGCNAKAQLLFKPKDFYELYCVNWVFRSMNQR